MRIYEHNFAYEIEQTVDPGTLVPTGWKYNLYRVRPVQQLLHSGTSATKELAEQEGKRAVQKEIRTEQEGEKPVA